MSKVVSAMDMRQNFGTLLNQVAIKDEEIVIERAGKPLARLVSMNSATSGKLFKAYKEKKVIYCNMKQQAYYEISPVQPDVLLKDFVAIFHPELVEPDYQPTYYRLLKWIKGLYYYQELENLRIGCALINSQIL